MADYLLKVLVVAILGTFITHTTNAEISEEQKTTIEKGLEAGKVLAEFLKDGKFRDSLVKLGTNLAPFLGALGPLAGIALEFIPTRDSAELLYMRKQFKEVDNKLDVITSEFREVKNAIDWSAIVISYGSYERKIRAAEENLNRIYEVEGPAREHYQKNFIIQYESDFDNSLLKLYDAIMENDHLVSKNILEAVVKQTKNHKRKVEQFSLGLVQLLVQGIKVKVSYYSMKKWATDHVTKVWTDKINNLRSKLETLSDEVKSVYLTQVKTDADDLILRHHGLGNYGLMQKIYNFVIEKYDWRYWFVAIYDDMVGHDHHTIALCYGYSALHKHGKNIIIASQDKQYASRFNKGNAENLLKNVEQDIDQCKSDTRNTRERARALVTNVGKKDVSGCVPLALHMAVMTGKGLWFISSPSHMAYRKIEKRKYCCWGGFWDRRCRTVRWSHYLVLFG